jgi:protein tyrosine phosphatase
MLSDDDDGTRNFKWVGFVPTGGPVPIRSLNFQSFEGRRTTRSSIRIIKQLIDKGRYQRLLSMKWKLNFLNTQNPGIAKGPISPIIENKEIPQYLAKDKTTLMAEFQQLGSEEAERVSIKQNEENERDNWSVTDGIRNRDRNRYINVVPWDKTRVKLKTDNGEESDYINASWVNLLGKDYIAAQAPLHHTIPHFWNMIRQNNVHVVVMLTEVDHGCTKYWSDDQTFELNNEFGVECVEVSQVNDHYTIRKFVLNGDYEVYHFHFSTWIDFGSPDANASLTDFVKDVNEKNGLYNGGSGPLLVHCSAGIGRTGTYLAVDAVLQNGQDQKQNPDLIFDLVSDMRKQRAGMVQRLEQYVYIHKELKKLYC